MVEGPIQLCGGLATSGNENCEYWAKGSHKRFPKMTLSAYDNRRACRRVNAHTSSLTEPDTVLPGIKNRVI